MKTLKLLITLGLFAAAGSAFVLGCPHCDCGMPSKDDSMKPGYYTSNYYRGYGYGYYGSGYCGGCSSCYDWCC